MCNCLCFAKKIAVTFYHCIHFVLHCIPLVSTTLLKTNNLKMV